MLVVLHLQIALVFLSLLVLVALSLFMKFDKGSIMLREKYGMDFKVERIIRSNLQFSYYISSNTISEKVDNHFIISIISSGRLVFECSMKNTTDRNARYELRRLIAEFEELGESPTTYRNILLP